MSPVQAAGGQGLVDGTEQGSPGLVEVGGGVIIADAVGDGVERGEGEAGPEVLVGFG